MSARHPAGAYAFVAAAAFVAIGCDNPDTCEDARKEIEQQIEVVCQERPFVRTAFCSLCVPNGLYSIDDSCSCRVLNFDADFCLYAPHDIADAANDKGTTRVREAVIHAAAVCEGRDAGVSWNTPSPNASVPDPDDDGGAAR